MKRLLCVVGIHSWHSIYLDTRSCKQCGRREDRHHYYSGSQWEVVKNHHQTLFRFLAKLGIQSARRIT